MNTNYSKIALLLALTALGAGNKVGAKINMDYVDGAQFNSDSRKSVVKNQYSETFKKLQDTSKSVQLSGYLDDIQKTHYSKNKVAVTFVDNFTDGSKKLNAEGQKVFGLDADDLVNFLKDQDAKKALKKVIKADFKALLADITEIKSKSSGTTATSTSFLDISGNSKANIEDFVAKCSKSKISDLLKSGFKKDSIEDIVCRTKESDEIVGILAQEQANLSKKISELSNDISLVSSDTNNPKVNVKAALVSLNNGIHDWASGLSKSLLSTPDVGQNILVKLDKAAKRSNAVGKFLSKMNVNAANANAGKILLSRACDGAKGTPSDLSTLTTALGRDATGGNLHSKALATYLATITGETAANLNTAATNVLYYGYSTTAGTERASRVELTELGSAFGTAAPNVVSFDANGSTVDAVNIKNLTDVFKPLDDLRAALTVISGRTLPSENAYAIIKQNSEGLDVGFKLNVPSWNLDDGSTPVHTIAPYFEDVTRRIKDLKTTSAETFKTVSGEWAKTLTAAYTMVDNFIQSKSVGIMGSASAATGLLAGLSLENITDVRLKIKTAYDAAIAELNVAPVTGAKKASAATTIEDLTASEEFKATKLNVSELSTEFKTLLSKETDLGKAQALYAKILAGLPVEAATNAPSATDVAELKKLFASEVKDLLEVKTAVTPAAGSPSSDLNDDSKNDVKNPVPTGGKIAPGKKGATGTIAADDDDDDLNFVNVATGAAAKGKEATAANKKLNATIKEIVAELTADNEDDKKELNKAKIKSSNEMIQGLVEKFNAQYDEEVEQGEDEKEEEYEKKKANAVKKATALITAKVKAAFGLGNPTQAKKPLGKGTGKGGKRVRNRKGAKPGEKTNKSKVSKRRGRGRGRSKN